MGRLKRIYFESSWYHITARGNNRYPILGSDVGKSRFISTLRRYQDRRGFIVLGFIVMDNHFHLLLEAGEKKNVSKIMQGILLSYSCWYRTTHGYVGHVWQGRFVSRVIQDERQLKETVRYIHENPVKAGIVKQAEDYPWSSAGLENRGMVGDVEGLMVRAYTEAGDSSDRT